MKTVDLKTVCSVIMGQAPPGSSYNNDGVGLPLIAGAGDFSELTPKPSRHTTASSRCSQKGDIILCIRATIGDRNWSDGEYCLGRGVAGLRPHSGLLDSRYLWHWIGISAEVMRQRARGSTFKQISKDAIETLKIPLPLKPDGTPDLDEQRRIAAILDKADEVRRKRQEAIRLTEELLRSAFFDMFGDPVTNPKGWEEANLGDYLVFLTSGSRGWAKYYSSSGEKFLRIQNVGRNELLLNDLAFVSPPNNAEARRTQVRPGDVLLSITADLGRTAVIPESFGAGFINQHLALLRVRGISPLYLSAYLASEGGQRQFRKLNREGVKAGLNFDDIRSLCILRPPLKKQHTFERLWNYHRQYVGKHLAYSFKVDQLFNSLVQRAFKGELL